MIRKSNSRISPLLISGTGTRRGATYADALSSSWLAFHPLRSTIDNPPHALEVEQEGDYEVYWGQILDEYISSKRTLSSSSRLKEVLGGLRTFVHSSENDSVERITPVEGVRESRTLAETARRTAIYDAL